MILTDGFCCRDQSGGLGWGGAAMGSDVPMPDLSHLTEEERQKILSVMNRHRQENQEEIKMIKSGT